MSESKPLGAWTSPGAILAMQELLPARDPYSSESESSDISPSERHVWEWESCVPALGATRYVSALQLLGIELAKAVPNEVKANAITPLPDPTGDIVVGRFGKKPTKERLLSLGCIKWATKSVKRINNVNNLADNIT